MEQALANPSGVNSNLLIANASSNDTDPGLPTYTGFIFLLGSSFFYGSNYIPVKQYETGDGLFFQLILCSGIWTVGFVVNCARNFPQFHPLAMLGGLLWTTGNINTVPIIKCIGMGLGIIFWGTIGLITGWATARFGWFGLKPDVPSNQVLNYVGVVLALSSAVFYLFVRTDLSKNKTAVKDEVSTNTSEVFSRPELSGYDQGDSLERDKQDFFDRLSLAKKRIIGIGLACFSGLMYGQAFTPVIYLGEQDQSSNLLDYLFSFYTGLFVTSLLYFIIYSIVKKNRPVIYPNIILPGLVSGWMWGIANVCYFLATNVLSQGISYPISNCGPPIFSTLWGVLVYKEIRGWRNLAWLFSGFAVAITASVLIGISF